MDNNKYISITELNQLIKETVTHTYGLSNIMIVGEVSGFGISGSHAYFTVKDQFSQIDCVFFNIRSSSYIPTNGKKVVLKGSVNFYEARGRINFLAREISEYGIGDLYKQFEELKKKLFEQGIFDESHKKPIPEYPVKIGLITSKDGAAVHDFLTTANKIGSKQDITIIDVRVQGQSAAEDIAKAIVKADLSNMFDVIVVARGGGSFEDLFCFNDERIVMCIYNANTPIVTGIGHEVDYTLCDYVSDFRAITPTAAAQKVCFSIEDEKNRILENLQNMQLYLEKNYNSKMMTLEKIGKTLEKDSNVILQKQYGKLENNLKTIKLLCEQNLKLKMSKYDSYVSKLDVLNPSVLLKKGYFRIVHDKKDIFDFDKIKENDDISIIGANDKITAKVIKKEKV